MYTVLLADDNKKICNGLANIIEQRFPNLKILGQFYSGEDVLAKIDETMPDIVISDIHMPGADGLEICRLIRKRSQNTQIILITGYQEFEYAKKAIDYKVSSFLIKPCPSEQIIDSINTAIHTIEAHIQNAQDSSYSYLAKWEETKKRIAALYYGIADSEKPDIFLLSHSTPIQECKVSELNLIPEVTADINDALEFDSPNLSAFCVQNRLLIFFKDRKYKESYLDDCKKNTLCKDALSETQYTQDLSFQEWNESASIKLLAESMAAAFKELRIDAFISHKKNALQNIKDLSALFRETAAILECRNLDFAKISPEDSVEASVLYFFNAYLSFNSALSVKIKLFIENNYQDPNLSVNDIAERFMMTNNYIGEYFNTHTGLSLREYINDIRINAAKKYIAANPDATNDEVSKAVGYNSLSYFHRIFKKLTHMTPTQFRKNMKNI